MRKVFVVAFSILFVAGLAMAQDWGYITLTNSLDHLVDVQTGDLNGDGYLDIVTTQYHEGKLTWWENDGDAQFVAHEILTGRTGITHVDIADIDNDGDLDVAYAQEGFLLEDDQAGWVSNDNGDGLAWTEAIISDEGQGAMGTPWNLRMFDFDSDGDLDAAVTGSQISWFRNPGDGSDYWIRTDVDFNNFSRVGIEIGDVNGDGRMDVISARGNGIAWWNDLSWGHVGTNWQFFTIGGAYEAIKAVDVGDLDGDGDLDVITCGDVGYGSTVSIFSNFSGSGSSWDRSDLSYGFFNVQDVNVADIDGDGDLDVVAAAFGDDEVAWWENLGNLQFQKHVISIQFNGAAAVAPANLDMDDDMEILAGAYAGGRLGFWDQNSSQYQMSLTLTPSADPLIVPYGGSFQYDLFFTADTPGNMLARYWIYIILQNTRERTVDNTQFTYVEDYHFDIEGITQSVQGGQPGPYTLVVGVDIANEYVTDQFTFTIQNPPRAVPQDNSNPWQMAGFDWVGKPSKDLAGAGTRTVPTEFELKAAYPNPFNPATTVSVALPDASDLTVRAFNVNGQQVAEIANGRYSAGTHKMTFDASNLASGLYFIQAQVPGELNATQKVMLVR